MISLWYSSIISLSGKIFFEKPPVVLNCLLDIASTTRSYGVFEGSDESSKTKQEKQSVEKEEKKTQQKTESQEITDSKKDITKKEESESKQPVQETSEEIEQETDESEEVASVNVTITGIDGVMAQDYIEYEEGMSAYDALKILAGNYEMDVKASGLGQAVYVKGVNGLMEFDYGGQSGWKYKVNGAYPSLSAGAYMLKADDQVEWVYTTNG